MCQHSPIPCFWNSLWRLWDQRTHNISSDFLLDGFDVYNLVENNEHWNKSEFILGENFTSGVSINHQENQEWLLHTPFQSREFRYKRVMALPRESCLQAWKYLLSISFVIKCLPKSHHTLPYNFFSTYFKCTCNWVPIQWQLNILFQIFTIISNDVRNILVYTLSVSQMVS